MKLTQTLAVAALFAAGTTAMAGVAIDLAPNQVSGTLSGLDNTMFPEIRGQILADNFYDFSISAGTEGVGEELVYEGTLMTRVARSNMTGMITINYRLINPNGALDGAISNIEISGFEGYQTRVEYRGNIAPGDEGPVSAARDASGDLINFSFGENLQTNEESKFFFVMLDTQEYSAENSVATLTLQSGESVSFRIDGAVPTPGALSLLSVAGLISVRRRR